MRQIIYSSALAISALYAAPSFASDYCDDLFALNQTRSVQIKLSDLHSFTKPKNMHTSKSGYNYSGKYLNIPSDLIEKLDQLMLNGPSQETCTVMLGHFYALRHSSGRNETVDIKKKNRKTKKHTTSNNTDFSELTMAIDVILPSMNLKVGGLYLDLIRSIKKIDHLAFEFERPQLKAPENNNDIRAPQANNLPVDFDADAYLSLNNDVLKAAQSKGIAPRLFAALHYMQDGKNEGRQYKLNLPEDFNADTYLNVNADVRAAQQNSGKTPEEFAREHYFKHGRNEGRRYK